MLLIFSTIIHACLNIFDKQFLFNLPKLTDASYYLPIIQALEAGKTLNSGRTKPMIVRGVCTQDGQKGEYVVKFNGSEEMYPGACLNELLASLIAMELDFLVPEPVIINITLEFVETMRHKHDNYLMATKSIGFNFGSTLNLGFQEVVPGQTLGYELKAKLPELFALDVFLGNTDRRIDKPNFLSNGKDFLIYDHEMAFSFTRVLPFARNPSPWLIVDSDKLWLSNNYCFNQLKRNNFDFSNFATRLNVIDKSFWEKAESIIPAEWQNDHFDSIRGYLNKIVEMKNEFASELNRILL